jgi:hypothetical protein
VSRASGARWLAPVMAALLAGYIAIHSPLLGLVGQVVGRGPSRCYFACSGWAPNSRPLDAIAAGLCLALATVAAAWLSRRLEVDGAERALAFGLALVALVVVPAGFIGLASWRGLSVSLRPPLGPLLVALPATVLLVVKFRTLLAGRPRWPACGRPRAVVGVVGATALSLLLVSLTVHLFHPPTGYDAVAYHAPLGVYFWRDGDIASTIDDQRWAWALAHPGSFELWAGLLRLAGGERVADLAGLPFALLGAVAVYVFGRRSGLGRGAATLGASAFLLAPMVALQAGTQLNDLAGATLVMAAAALVAAPSSQWSASRLGLAGLALGLAAGTKVATLPAVGTIGLYLVIRAVRGGNGGRLPLAAAAGVLAVAPWWLRNALLFGNPVYPAALPFIGGGLVQAAFGPPHTGVISRAALWPFYPLLENHSATAGVGALFAVAALPGLAVAVRRARARVLLLYGALAGVGLPTWWLMTRHDPRFLLYVVGLGFAFVGWTLVAVPRRWRAIVAGLLCGAAVFSAAVTVDEGLRPLARAPTDRARFYEEVWGVDSMVAGLPSTDALLSHTGLAPLSWASDYALLGGDLGRRLVVIDGPTSADSIEGIMRPRGIRYAYVPADDSTEEDVRRMYPSTRFDLVRSSSFRIPAGTTIRRHLFRLRMPATR